MGENPINELNEFIAEFSQEIHTAAGLTAG